MKVTQAHYEAPQGHIVLTGPARGVVTLQDGTTYDVSAPAVEVQPDHAEEVAHLASLQIETLDLHPLHDAEGRGDKEPFVYEVPKKFKTYDVHPDNDFVKGI